MIVCRFLQRHAVVTSETLTILLLLLLVVVVVVVVLRTYVERKIRINIPNALSQRRASV